MNVEIKVFVGRLRASIYVQREVESTFWWPNRFVTLERVSCWRWQVGRETARLERKWEGS